MAVNVDNLTLEECEGMELDELEAVNIQLSNHRTEIQQFQRSLAGIIDRKIHARDAEALFDQMSDAQKAALHQVASVHAAEIKTEAKKGGGD